MLQFWGNLLEIVGKPVNKVNFVVPLGGGRYAKIGQKYFGNDERKVKFRKKEYFVSVEKTIVDLGQLRISYVVHDETKPQQTLTFTGKIIDGMTPEEIDTLAFNGHVKTALHNAVSGNIGLIVTIMALGIGLAVGFMLGQNLPAITQAISGPTPTPQFGGP